MAVSARAQEEDVMVKQVRAARTRQALVRAAAEVFAEDGYAMASLPAISKRAGVSAGALHFHFASKDALAREVESAAAECAQALAEQCRSSSATLLQSLVGATGRLLAFAGADPVVRAGFRLGADPSRKGAGALQQWWQTWVGDLLEEAQEGGELAEGVCAGDAAGAIVAATVGLEVLGGAEPGRLSGERVAGFWAFVLPRLAARPQQAALTAAPPAGEDTE
ncbi:ScbR family autoregulator-binding transcription factor [Streptomyces sp. NPDC005423]|uniref:ScbR family autoregulator-binding transcription factor n=1 Tax=Streptomyces sp. NPDC005423 TaxID=3155343 RepID=UPI0033A7A22E